MDKIFYCVPTYKSFQECIEGIHTVQQGSLRPTDIIICDNSGDGSGTNALHTLTQQYTNVYIWPQNRNIGVAAAWNKFMALDQDYVIIANDDIKVHHDSIEKLISAADTHPDDVLFTSAGLAGNAYSFFLLKQKGYKAIGMFDERFYPAYFEDNDYDYRRRLLGYTFVLIPDLTLDHVGSSTLKKYTQDELQQHHYAFNRNNIYYQNKWGGNPGVEKYTTPFGVDI